MGAVRLPKPGRRCRTDSSGKFAYGYSIGLNACVNKGETIECGFVFTIDRDVGQRLGLQSHIAWFSSSKLIDNFGHRASRRSNGYFENGRCESQESLNLAPGDHVLNGAGIRRGKGRHYTSKNCSSQPFLDSVLLNGPVTNGGLPAAVLTKIVVQRRAKRSESYEGSRAGGRSGGKATAQWVS